MSDEQVALDRWVSDTIHQTEPAKREYVSRFRKEWSDGAHHHPALYPLNQSEREWLDHFEWFLTIDRFEAPGLPATPSPSSSATGCETGVVEETVVYNSATDSGQMETVVVDRPESLTAKVLTAGKSKPLPPKGRPKPDLGSMQAHAAGPADGLQAEAIDELDDLGTLIIEAAAPPNQSPRETQSATPTKPAGTSQQDQAKTPHGHDQDELDDLGTLIREAETQQKKEQNRKPDSTGTAGSSKRPPDPTVAQAPSKAKPSSPSGQATGPTPKPLQAGRKPAAKPTTSATPAVAKGPTQNPTQNADSQTQQDLDLDDLDTMTWLDD